MLNVPRATQGPFLWTTDTVTPVPQPTVPTPTTPVVTTPVAGAMTVAYRARVICTYDRVIRHFKDHFAGYPTREYVSEVTYQIGYPEDQWGKNGSVVAALAYVHSRGQFTVVWANGDRQDFGTINEWMAFAGC